MRGSVYQRKDKRWVGVVDIGKDEKGKRRQKYVYGPTEKETTIKLNNLIYELQNNMYTEDTKDTFLSFLNEYHKIKSITWESTTSALYRNYIDVHFSEYFKQIRLADIRPSTLDKFYNEKLESGLGNNMVRKLHVFAKAALNYAVKNNIIKTNPANNVTPPKKIKFTPNIYTEEQFMKLMNHIIGTDDEIPIILAAGCGFRRGEVFGLKWSDIDLDKGTIKISRSRTRYDKDVEKAPKNESSKRIIKCPEYVIDTLKKYKAGKCVSESDHVVAKWLPQSYSERFKKLLRKYELEHIRFHDLRHYNAVIMMSKGVPDKVAATRLGQSQVSTLREVYQHVLQEMDEKTADTINKAFSGVSKCVSQ